MGLFDELKKLTRPYDSEEDGFIDEAESVRREPVSQGRSGPYSGYSGSQGTAGRPPSGAAVVSSSSASAGARHASAARTQKREGRVVSIPGGAGAQMQQQMILVRPERFENARSIADNLRDRRPILLNLETTPKDISRRLLDFLSGVAYAQDGKIQQIASNTYIIMPYNVDLTGDFAGEFADNFESGSAYL